MKQRASKQAAESMGWEPKRRPHTHAWHEDLPKVTACGLSGVGHELLMLHSAPTCPLCRRAVRG